MKVQAELSIGIGREYVCVRVFHHSACFWVLR